MEVHLKKIVIVMLVLFALTGCTSNEATISENDIVLELKDEITELTSSQNDILNEITALREQVSEMEKALEEKDEVLEVMQMSIDDLYRGSDYNYDYFSDLIAETKRLYCNDEKVIIEVYMVEAYSYENSQITVKDRNENVLILDVSDFCRVVVAGQHSMVYQTLEEGQDFLDYIVEDQVHKVKILMKDGVVEQIIMHDNSWEM